MYYIYIVLFLDNLWNSKCKFRKREIRRCISNKETNHKSWINIYHAHTKQQYPISKLFNIWKQLELKELTYLNSSLSVLSSCSIYRKTWTSSLTITGHKDVACCGDILNSKTRKHRNTCAWIDGITWGRRKLSAKRSEIRV